MRKCQIFQVNTCKERRPAFPLYPVMVENTFEQWGLDVVNEINPNSLKLHKYILTTTNYFTRWTKVIPLKNVNDNEVIQFLQWNIITRFGVPNSLVFDNAKYFSSLKIVEFALKHNIIMIYSTNKNLLWIIKKIVLEHQRIGTMHLTLLSRLIKGLL